MVAQDACPKGDGVPGVDGAVSPHLQGQLVIVGGVPYAGVFHRIVDLAHRGIDGVHGDHPDNGLGGLVLVGGNVAPAVGQGQLHGQAGLRSQGGDVQVRIENLHIGVRLDVAGGDPALPGGLDVDGLGALAVQLGDNALHIQDNLGHVLLDAGDGGKLMLDPGYLDGGHCRARQRGQQNPPQGVAQGSAVTPLQRLHHILAVGGVAGIFHAFDAGLFNFYHMLGYPPFLGGALAPLHSAHQYLRVV